MVLEHGGRRTGFSRHTTHSGNYVGLICFAAWINVLSGRGSGRRLFQKGGLPGVSRRSAADFNRRLTQAVSHYGHIQGITLV